jgi:hypothetical protein
MAPDARNMPLPGARSSGDGLWRVQAERQDGEMRAPRSSDRAASRPEGPTIELSEGIRRVRRRKRPHHVTKFEAGSIGQSGRGAYGAIPVMGLLRVWIWRRYYLLRLHKRRATGARPPARTRAAGADGSDPGKPRWRLESRASASISVTGADDRAPKTAIG